MPMTPPGAASVPQNPAQPPQMQVPGQPAQRPEPSEQDKALAKDWKKRIDAAQERHKTEFKQFEVNRKLLRGQKAGNSNEKQKANLHFANQAMLVPQIYAKDPEYSVTPTARVSEREMEAVKLFAETAEVLLGRVLVKDAKLKKRAKQLLRSAFATSVGWWKVTWQENRRTDPMILNGLKDTQDNIDNLQVQRQALDETNGRDQDLAAAKVTQTIAGIQSQSEVSIVKGLVVDFAMSEDILILDDSVRCFGDYESASAMAHRVWMTKDKYKALFGYEPTKAKYYKEQAGSAQMQETSTGDKSSQLFCVWEIWDQDSNRVFTICDGEEGFCKQPESPNWTGKRWYPFFGVGFNEIDGSFYPLSDVELTDPLVKLSNESLDDFVEDRRDSRPINLVRKGGAFTDEDVTRIRNRNGCDITLVEGVGTGPISNDIFIGSLAKIDPQVYSTDMFRLYMEMIIGGGDAARGSVLKAKTATEAEILSQGLRGRSQERQDSIEDLLSEVGQYAVEIMLRRMTEQEVQRIAGPDAAWPTMDIEQIFDAIDIEVKGGSTGRPDRLQEQDRWTKLLPVIKEAIQQVAELRAQGQDALAQAIIVLTRETLRRFEERLDIEQLLPPKSDGQPDAAQLMQQMNAMKEQLQVVMQELQQAKIEQEKGYITAATSLATSANPAIAVPAFALAMQAIETSDVPDMSSLPPQPEPEDPGQEGAMPPGMPPELTQQPLPPMDSAPIDPAADPAMQPQ